MNEQTAPESVEEEVAENVVEEASAEEAAAEEAPVEEAAAPEEPEEEPEPEEDTPLDPEHVRMAEALLFAAAEPLDIKSLKERLPNGANVNAALEALAAQYEERGVNLAKIGGKWAFRTAPDMAFLMERERQSVRRLSRAAIETLAIIAYHQPVTRAEIEEIRGVVVSKGTLDVLIETEWVRLRGRRRTPGRPVTYGVTDNFLQHFGLESLDDLPGAEELKAAGLLDSRLPTSFSIEGANPADQEEDPLEEEGDVSDMLASTLSDGEDEEV